MLSACSQFSNSGHAMTTQCYGYYQWHYCCITKLFCLHPFILPFIYPASFAQRSSSFAQTSMLILRPSWLSTSCFTHFDNELFWHQKLKMAFLTWSETLNIPYSLHGSIMYFSPKAQQSGRQSSGLERLIQRQLLRIPTAWPRSYIQFFFFPAVTLYISRQKEHTFFSTKV